MDITWLVIIAAFAAIAVAGSLVTLRGRAPRIPDDPEQVARLRDRLAEVEARRLHQQVDERIAEEQQARGSAPQRTAGASLERVWAGGV